MRINLKTMAALAGSIVLSASIANAAPVLNVKPSSNASSNFVDLVRQAGSGAGGDGAALRGGGQGLSIRGPDHSAGRFADNSPRVRGGYVGNDRYVDNGSKVRRGSNFDRSELNGDRRRFVDRDHREGQDFNRHRVWRNGAWVWIYGPDIYTYGDDCGWLLRRAQMTGSPYWWDRYDACVY